MPNDIEVVLSTPSRYRYFIGDILDNSPLPKEGTNIGTNLPTRIQGGFNVISL